MTNRWSPLILAALLGEPLRFSALNTKVQGISQKMLSQNLKVLVRSGLVERSVASTIPPQVTYTLTASGTELATMMCGLIHWMGGRTEQFRAAHERYDADSNQFDLGSGHSAQEGAMA
ncbi:winged helix-turn-helix transcriptional regulator [Deinococcus marmoris]|uniref:winged helix-turn-helix transcriptional regulator n=1 Tax=Deinococcus marmoris TaxID=249408 RepID=UPI001C3779F6|nr:helix-turn-helix domain-containing protein [Deinococcus marmoris]